MERTATPKKRKVRKGTSSCWECKRRKTRCTFTIPSEATCDGCRSRRTNCISQEFCNQPPGPTAKLGRLERVEALVQRLAERTHDQSDLQAATESAQVSTLGTVYDIDVETHGSGHFDHISKALLDLWPSQDDLDIALSIPVDISVFSHGIICVSYAKYIANKLSSPRHVFQRPPHGSHPIIIARRLLMLATFLQGVPPSSSDKLAKMRCNASALMSRIIDIVHRMVTSNDELVSSLEGIECLMIESMFRNNAGNLRRAWLTNRRAMNLAQLMGLDKTGITTLSSMITEESTGARIDPEIMWFRIVCSDRYLSLMLGITQCSVDDSFVDPKIMRKCTPLEQLERLETVAGGLITQRNGLERPDFEMTCRIDQSLQTASGLLPPQWWMMGFDLSILMGNDEKALEERIRLTCHFAHYHLLVQLHLPYLLHSSSAGQSYAYNKMTAANASRTILTQYLNFRKSDASVTYCRGIDFIVFIASTTLCVAHIEARRHHKTGAEEVIPPLGTLLHQRQSDRGLLECVLQVMQTMAQMHKDPIASKVTKILEPLLAIELKSSQGERYLISFSAHGQDSEYDSDQEVKKGLLVDIPHFGTIKFKPDPLLSRDSQGVSLSKEELVPAVQLEGNAPGNMVVCGQGFPPIDSEISNPGQASSPTNDYQANYNQVKSSSWQDPLNHNGPSIDITGIERLEEASVAYMEDFLSTEFDPSTDEWSLQSVDTALFRSLMRGCVASPSEL